MFVILLLLSKGVLTLSSKWIVLEEAEMTRKPFISNWDVTPPYLPTSETINETDALETNKRPDKIKISLTELQMLIETTDLQKWLHATVEFLNRHDMTTVELSKVLHQRNDNERLLAISCFSAPHLIQCINGIFFYKLYPDKLFNALIHPEKLVSVRLRLGVLHHFIEELQMQLVHFAKLHGFKPELDYLLHGDDLPQGIIIEVQEEHRQLIQIAISHLKIYSTPENEAQITLDHLNDLGLAYKYWFNPNRLIAATMVLQQRLVKNKTNQMHDLRVFEQRMMELYGQLKTTECLHLYGYFSNKDSRYLINTLRSIIDGIFPDWLTSLNTSEINTILSVFEALQCVMEALRMELKNRGVITQPYSSDFKKQNRPGKRNREAVYRIISIYDGKITPMNSSVEKLFCLIEGKDKK